MNSRAAVLTLQTDTVQLPFDGCEQEPIAREEFSGIKVILDQLHSVDVK